jgi:hypothetical protein
MNTTYLVLNKGTHEFNLIVEKNSEHDKKFSLFTSDNSIWSEHFRNQLLFEIKDTGDNLIFSKKVKKVDYDVAEYIRILLSFIHNDYQGIKSEYTIIEKSGLITI